jgi:hypothetical protein
MELAGKYKAIGRLSETPFIRRGDRVNSQQWEDASMFDPGIRQALNRELNILETLDPYSPEALQLKQKINQMRQYAYELMG